MALELKSKTQSSDDLFEMKKINYFNNRAFYDELFGSQKRRVHLIPFFVLKN